MIKPKRILFVSIIIANLALTSILFADNSKSEGMTQKELYAITDYFVENKIYFNFPDGTYPIPQIEQEDVNYDLGYKVGHEGIEFRVVFISNDDLVLGSEDYKRSLNLLMYENLFNIAQSDKIKPEILEMNETAISDLFNADYGLTSVVKGNSQFSEGFDYVLITGIHKINKGTLFTFILADDKEMLINIEEPIHKYFTSFFFFKYEDRPY